jgi:hypothetical protein
MPESDFALYLKLKISHTENKITAKKKLENQALFFLLLLLLYPNDSYGSSKIMLPMKPYKKLINKPNSLYVFQQNED